MFYGWLTFPILTLCSVAHGHCTFDSFVIGGFLALAQDVGPFKSLVISTSTDQSCRVTLLFCG